MLDTMFESLWWEAPTHKYPRGVGYGDVPDLEEVNRASSLLEQLKALELRQREVHQQNLWNARLYGNREIAAFDWGTGAYYYNHSLAPVSLLAENLVMSVVDTMVSRVGKNRTKVTPVPHNGSWKLRRTIDKLDRWIHGEMTRMHAWRTGKQVFRDAAIFGYGGVRVEADEDGHLCLQRFFPDNLLVDQHEVVTTGGIRHIYEREVLPVRTVEATYGLPYGALGTHPAPQMYLPYRVMGANHVILARGWRAAGPDGPGRHVVACEGKVLVDREWPYEWLPHVIYHSDEPVVGFYWPSIVERVLPYQIRLNEVNEVIRDAQDLMARPRVLVAEGSRVNPQDVDNTVGRIIKYTGVKPEALVWPAVSAELYQERDRIVRTCFEQFGLSQMVSQGKLPAQARLDSSAALREATDISDDRLSDPTQRLEEWYLDLAETMIRVQRAFGSPAGKTTWSVGGKYGAETIEWKDADPGDHTYTMSLEPASLFSLTPAARRDTLEQWLAQGVVTPEEYRRQLAHPDLEGEESIQAAAAEDIDRVIDLLEDGDYESPDPVQDLVQGVQRVTLAYLRLSRYDDVPDEVKTNFVKWLSTARATLDGGTEDQASPAPSELPPVPGAAPPGAPMGPGGPTMTGGPPMGPPGLPPGGPIAPSVQIPPAAPVPFQGPVGGPPIRLRR
jgi:hypothetical protein